MHEQVQIMDQHADTRTWLAANAAFHATVYRCAARPRMIEMIGRTERLTCEHLGILEAVESGDPVLAGRLTSEHLTTSHDFILSYLLESRATAGVIPTPDPAAILHRTADADLVKAALPS
jgi:DNA-binding GntR family transcriptional regulator